MTNPQATNRNDRWEVEYACRDLANAAETKLGFRTQRAKFWRVEYDKVKAQIETNGVKIHESVAKRSHSMKLSQQSYTNQIMRDAPTIEIDQRLQDDLQECNSRVVMHENAAREYAGWVQFLRGNGDARMKLRIGDWLYFFGDDAVTLEEEND